MISTIETAGALQKTESRLGTKFFDAARNVKELYVKFGQPQDLKSMEKLDQRLAMLSEEAKALSTRSGEFFNSPEEYSHDSFNSLTATAPHFLKNPTLSNGKFSDSNVWSILRAAAFRSSSRSSSFC